MPVFLAASTVRNMWLFYADKGPFAAPNVSRRPMGQGTKARLEKARKHG